MGAPALLVRKAASFVEDEHPRASDGKFTSGGGSHDVPSPNRDFQVDLLSHHLVLERDKYPKRSEVEALYDDPDKLAEVLHEGQLFTDSGRKTMRASEPDADHLKYYAASMAAVRLKNSEARGAREFELDRRLRDDGKLYDEIAVDWPEHYSPGAKKLCFMNSYLNVRHHGLRYVEGEALARLPDGSGYPTRHAWNLDADGRVVDTTWDPGDGIAYYGVEIPKDDLYRRMLRTGVYGYFGHGHEEADQPGPPKIIRRPKRKKGEPFNFDFTVKGHAHHEGVNETTVTRLRPAKVKKAYSAVLERARDQGGRFTSEVDSKLPGCQDCGAKLRDAREAHRWSVGEGKARCPECVPETKKAYSVEDEPRDNQGRWTTGSAWRGRDFPLHGRKRTYSPPLNPKEVDVNSCRITGAHDVYSDAEGNTGCKSCGAKFRRASPDEANFAPDAFRGNDKSSLRGRHLLRAYGERAASDFGPAPKERRAASGSPPIRIAPQKVTLGKSVDTVGHTHGNDGKFVPKGEGGSAAPKVPRAPRKPVRKEPDHYNGLADRPWFFVSPPGADISDFKARTQVRYAGQTWEGMEPDHDGPPMKRWDDVPTFEEFRNVVPQALTQLNAATISVDDKSRGPDMRKPWKLAKRAKFLEKLRPLIYERARLDRAQSIGRGRLFREFTGPASREEVDRVQATLDEQLWRTRGIAAIIATKEPKTLTEARKLCRGAGGYVAYRTPRALDDVTNEYFLWKHNLSLLTDWNDVGYEARFSDARMPKGRLPEEAELELLDKTLTERFGANMLSGRKTLRWIFTEPPDTSLPGTAPAWASPTQRIACISVGLKDPIYGRTTDLTYTHEALHANSHTTMRPEYNAFNDWMSATLRNPGASTGEGRAAAKRWYRAAITDHGFNEGNHDRVRGLTREVGDFQEDWAIGATDWILSGRRWTLGASAAPRREVIRKLAELFDKPIRMKEFSRGHTGEDAIETLWDLPQWISGGVILAGQRGFRRVMDDNGSLRAPTTEEWSAIERAGATKDVVPPEVEAGIRRAHDALDRQAAAKQPYSEGRD